MNLRTGTYLLLLLVFGSCIKKEPLNPEADIEAITIDEKDRSSEPFIDQPNRKVMLYLTEEAYQKGVRPIMQTSKGASLYPASGDAILFTGPVHYTVVSQSGAYSKVYEVVAVRGKSAYQFGFEKWAQNASDKYEFPLEDDGSQLWSSGNPGAAIAGLPKDPKAYPTHSTSEAWEGQAAAELVTIKGTALTEMVGIRLIPGSLFYGNFNSQNALANPPMATEFGQSFKGIPDRFSGYYKYTPGAVFQDQAGNPVAGESDSCSIYAVLFKGPARLNGTNILSSDRIIAKAVLKDKSSKANFTHFDIPFEFVANADLSGELMLALVASSSHKGDLYAGAIGSRLVIDQVVVTRKP